MRPVRRGDRGRQVVDIQTRLRALNYDLGSEGADGLFGPKTEMAIRAFQQARLLLADGIVGDNTWQELVEAGYRLGERLLYLRIPHLRGDDVFEIQRALNELGFDCGPERGVFDSNTEDGLIEFQRNTGVYIDGVVGEATLEQLRRLEKSQPQVHPQIPDRMNGYVGKKSMKGLRVVVDPAHGGLETGVVGVRGNREKDLNLQLALELEGELSKVGAVALLSRREDQTLGLYDRVQAANQLEPDLYICLHHDANGNPDACGAATFYFSNGTYFAEAGKRLAGYVLDGLVQLVGRADLHTHGRKYACLREIECPAVRVEVGYLSHPAEGVELVHSETVARQAKAIVVGIRNYLARR